MYKAMTYLLGMTWCMAFYAPVQGATIYVDVDATGANDGTRWMHAFTSLSAGINRASAGDDVWVAEGTYGAITLKTGVRLYGGFAGTEGSASQSDPDAHVTYINKTGGVRPVTSIGNDSSTVLDGFCITGGRLGQGNRPNNGTGMYLEHSNATIVRCVITNNTSVEVVAGTVAIKGGSPTFVNCKFYGNDGGWACGALYNSASGSPTLVNCLFYDNVVTHEGGAVCNNWGAPTFINCTFAYNKATIGRAGAVWDYRGDAVFRNCIFWNNTAVLPGTDGIFNTSAAPSPSTVTYSIVQGGWGGTGNIDADPLFVDPDGPDNVLGTMDDNLRLLAGSPGIDASDNTAVPADTADVDGDNNTTEPTPIDLDGNPRFVDDADTADTGNGTPPIVDMGAYEFHHPVVPIAGIPTVSQWGLVGLTLGLLTASRLIFRRHRAATPDATPRCPRTLRTSARTATRPSVCERTSP